MTTNSNNNQSARFELALIAKRQEYIQDVLDAAQTLSGMLRADLLADTDAMETARFTATERHAMAVAIDAALVKAFEAGEEVYEAAGRLGLLS